MNPEKLKQFNNLRDDMFNQFDSLDCEQPKIDEGEIGFRISIGLKYAWVYVKANGDAFLTFTDYDTDESSYVSHIDLRDDSIRYRIAKFLEVTFLEVMI